MEGFPLFFVAGRLLRRCLPVQGAQRLVGPGNLLAQVVDNRVKPGTLPGQHL
jgi:hypothetical protein